MNNIKDNKFWLWIRIGLFVVALIIFVWVIPFCINPAIKVYYKYWGYVFLVVIQVAVLEIAMYFRDDPEKKEGYLDNWKPEKVKCNLPFYYTEIHTRSRAYGTHLWQVPFAYLAAVSLSISIIFKGDISNGDTLLTRLLPTIFYAAGFCGIFLLYFMEYLSSRNLRTAIIMKKLERYWELPESTTMVRSEKTPKKTPVIIIMPLFWLCVFLIASLFVLSIYFLGLSA